MSDATKKKIRETLDSLNWNYGRGDVIHVDFATSTFTRKPHQMRIEVRSFRFENNTLYAQATKSKSDQRSDQRSAE
jgi:hypothetical protein